MNNALNALMEWISLNSEAMSPGKVTVDEGLGEHLALWNVVELLLEDVFLDLLEVLDVLVVGQLVHVDPLRLVAPQPHDLGGRGDAVVGREEEPLEDVGEVPQVEDVVELDGGWHENLQ